MLYPEKTEPEICIDQTLTMPTAQQPGPLSRLLGSALRVFFTTLIFTAGGMGLGLLLGILGMVSYGLIAHVQPDMRHAYLHFAIPLAITVGCVAFIGALMLEVRARRTPRA